MGGFTSYFDSLGCRSQLKLNIGKRTIIDSHYNIFLLRRLEALCFNFHAVGVRNQVRHGVISTTVGCRFLCRTLTLVGNRDLGAYNGRAGRICHSSDDASVNRLAGGLRCPKAHDERACCQGGQND